MDALLMCGGRGTRLRPPVDAEKPLVTVGDSPMIGHVIEALRASHVEEVFAAVSPATPSTADWVAERTAVTGIETPGDGYVADLTTALERVETPIVTVTADLPLLTGHLVDRTIEAAGGESVTVCVPLSVAEEVGASADTTVDHEGRTVVPTGLNVVGSGSGQRVVWDSQRLALNVNKPTDIWVAEQLFTDLR